jgi:uncharacterized protein YukJ
MDHRLVDKKMLLIVPEKALHDVWVLHMNQGQFLEKNYLWKKNAINIPTTGVGLDSGTSPW